MLQKQIIIRLKLGIHNIINLMIILEKPRMNILMLFLIIL